MEKSIFASKTFWGAVITVAAPFLDMAGIDMGDKEALVESIVGLIGAAIVIYGRFTAFQQVKVRVNK